MAWLWNALFAGGVVSVLLFWVGCAVARALPGAEGSHRGERGADLTRPEESSAKRLLRERLEALAIAEPPADLQTMGAMCYDVAAPPMRAEYVCPVCGAKTLYGQHESALIEWELPACRRIMEQVDLHAGDAVLLDLDERQFCKSCSPETEKPQLVLVASYPGEREQSRLPGVGTSDLRLVDEFLIGSDRHKGETDEESALGSHAHRLAELLGLAVTLDRETLTQQLGTLIHSPPPDDLSMGAMCYSPALLPLRAEYVCPSCARHTTYTGGTASVVRDAVPQCRRRMRALTEVDVTLDESEFCATCRPGIENPQLVLTIALAGEEPRRIRGVSADDVALLTEFLEGSGRHATANDTEVPLKDLAPRIAELLGIPGA